MCGLAPLCAVPLCGNLANVSIVPTPTVLCLTATITVTSCLTGTVTATSCLTAGGITICPE